MSTDPAGSPPGSPAASHWRLDPGVDFLNHGSFGATPHAVLTVQSELRARLEQEPVRFMERDLPQALVAARTALAGFVGAAPEDLVFVPNATNGVNAVLRSVDFLPGNEIVVTDHSYPAVRYAVEYVAARSGARIVEAKVGFPISGARQVLDAVTSVVTDRTRLVIVDHVTSPTAVVWPVARLVEALPGVDVLVDGAHAPGMLDLDVGSVGAAYYTGNCHKWLCAPKGAGFLVVRPDRQAAVVPTVISHGWGDPRHGSPFEAAFSWLGTGDPTAYLSVPAAIEVMAGMVPGGWDEIRRRNHELVLAGRDVVAGRLGASRSVPDGMLGSMASLTLPGIAREDASAVKDRLLDEHGIEVPIVAWSGSEHALVRLSAQLYNDPSQYERLAEALVAAGAGRRTRRGGTAPKGGPVHGEEEQGHS